ncbi:MAG: c-type cytochrome [Rhizobiaceae bacterium]
MKTSTFLIVAAMAATATVSALAHEGATGVVKERMLMMKDVSSQMKSLGQMIKGELGFDPKFASSAARNIASHGREMLVLFPEGSIDEPSKALETIWQEWDQFERITRVFIAQANELAEVSQTASKPTEIIPQYKALTQTCSTCHQDYRKPD